MSDIRIKDGHGTGNMANVDDHGRLYVNANMVPHEQHHASFHKNMFTATFEVVLPDGNEHELMFYKNTHTGKDYEFYDMVVSANAALEIKMYFGSTYVSGGNAVAPVNTNRGSGKEVTGELYEGGAVADLSLGTASQIAGPKFMMAANSPYAITNKGALILPTGTTMHMTATGSAATTAIVTIYFARHNADYKL